MSLRWRCEPSEGLRETPRVVSAASLRHSPCRCRVRGRGMGCVEPGWVGVSRELRYLPACWSGADQLPTGRQEMSSLGPQTCRGGDRVVGHPNRQRVPDSALSAPDGRKGHVCLVSPMRPGARLWAGPVPPLLV